jgi:hypothetical protein
VTDVKREHLSSSHCVVSEMYWAFWLHTCSPEIILVIKLPHQRKNAIAALPMESYYTIILIYRKVLHTVLRLAFSRRVGSMSMNTYYQMINTTLYAKNNALERCWESSLTKFTFQAASRH